VRFSEVASDSITAENQEMEYLLEEKKKGESEGLYTTYCPKCGLIVPSPDVPCSWCNFSKETELTEEEAREFTFAG